jgi:hypothetical protein
MRGVFLLVFFFLTEAKNNDLFAWEKIWSKSYYQTLDISETATTKGRKYIIFFSLLLINLRNQESLPQTGYLSPS